jgi:hypothetical protein
MKYVRYCFNLGVSYPRFVLLTNNEQPLPKAGLLNNILYPTHTTHYVYNYGFCAHNNNESTIMG